MAELKSIPQIGLGTFPFSGVFSEVNDNQAGSIIDYYLANGGEYIEIAPVYNYKVNLADILAEHNRETYYLACKCVTGKDAEGKVIRSGAYAHIIQQCEQQLEKFKTGYFDLFQTHIVPEDVSIEETTSALLYLQQNNMIKDLGVSNVSLAQLKEYSQYCKIRFVQNRFSLINQTPHKSIDQYCTEHNILYNPYQVIERGLLTSAPSSNGSWPKNDLRQSKHEYIGEPYTVLRSWIEAELLPLASGLNIPLEALIIGWTLRQKNMGIAVIGVTKPAQLENIHQYRNVSIPDAVFSRIDSLFKNFMASTQHKYNLTVEEFRGLL